MAGFVHPFPSHDGPEGSPSEHQYVYCSDRNEAGGRSKSRVRVAVAASLLLLFLLLVFSYPLQAPAPTTETKTPAVAATTPGKTKVGFLPPELGMLFGMDKHTKKASNPVECVNGPDINIGSTTIEWSQHSIYTTGNQTEQDKAWDAISIDAGVVAVDKSWALENGLPLGFDFPWDRNRSVYLVNAYHNLHCLVK